MATLAGNLAYIRTDIYNHFNPNPTVYWLGDASHAATVSDHNPDSHGRVHAIDVMFPVGSKATAVVKACIGRSDLKYVIHNRTIWSAAYGWKARKYTGSNPHRDHVHISGKSGSTAEGRRTHLNWGVAAKPAAPVTVPAYPGELSKGDKSTGVRTLQARLNTRGYKPTLKVDGDFGGNTDTHVRAFQRWAGLKVDGIVGPQTWRALWVLKIT